MARKVVVELVDDIDGTDFGEDGESISYGLDGVEYVIDLKDEHAKEFREVLDYYITHSIRVGGRKHRSDRPAHPTTRSGHGAKRRRSAPGRSSRATNSPPADASPQRSSTPSTLPTDKVSARDIDPRGAVRFKDKYPELFRQLDPARNSGIDLDSIPVSSHEMLWWRCPVGHQWRETPLQRCSPAMWKNGDVDACLYCVAPGCLVYSCGHRSFRSSESTFRVLAHPCAKCEITEHVRLILDAVDDSAGAAVALLDADPYYARFCAQASEIVEWWDEIFPLVEAYFVRMVSVYVAIAVVEHRPELSYPTSSLLGACMLRILAALPHSVRDELHSAVPDDAGDFRRTHLPGRHNSEIGWSLKKLGFDILDTPLDDDVERRLQFCEQQRFSATGEQPPIDLHGRHYPPFAHLPRDRERGASSELRGFRSKQLPPRIPAVRVTLGESSPADTDDPLGRTHLGTTATSPRTSCGSAPAECGNCAPTTSPRPRSPWSCTTRPSFWSPRSPD